MPTLQFKGKAAIWNHHLSVPYHTLEEDRKLHYKPEKGDGNLIIEGDNLLALKALLPQYAGKIKCIYIDPPYNTGNEHWVYNDNVNSPLIKEWIGKEVGKDDLTRHDKWLCMMVPRLKLLRELLADDGVIFISIGIDEVANIDILLQDILGTDNRISIPVREMKKGANRGTHFAPAIDYLVCYARQKNHLPEFHMPIDDQYIDSFDQTLGDRKYKTTNLYEPSLDYYENCRYWITCPDGSKVITPENKSFSHNKDSFDGLVKNDCIEFKKTPEGSLLIDHKGKAASWNVLRRLFLDEALEKGRRPSDLIVNHINGRATRELNSLGIQFDYAKPVSLIKYLLSLLNDKDSIVLDSFAGSGTTMHAIMELNKEDGGNRKCILVQMTEADEKDPKKNICKDITRERVKRAIDKNGYESGFRYLRVGQPIDAETMLAGNLPSYKDFAKYVYYLCTGQHLPDEKSIVEKEFFVGLTGKTGIYLIYKKDPDALSSMALNLSQAEAMRSRHPEGRLVVYAPACFLDEEYMREHGIEFVSIPYGMFTKTGERA